MGSFIFGLLWFLITIAFLTMFIITIVRIAKKGKILIPLISSIILFIVGLICFIGIFMSIPENEDYSVNENKATENTEKSSSENNDSQDDDVNGKKSLKIGDQLTVGKVDVTVEKAEFVEPEDEYSTPDNAKILKVYYKFKNNAEDQILVSDTDFLLSIDGETQQEFYLMDDMKAGFDDQLNKGNTASGYVYYDVPDSDEYKVEMDFMPFYNTYKAEWVINKSDIQ
ncbi:MULTISPECIES: DUF4352 domain-containing protein [unclassified Mammaliicoccus]|uniref:DUF4352 domain-containing protein n=1 Tax=unclassified Mammaliicoccus TaxID=2803851 RepID=UPI001EFBCBB0|nr:MULTISPECIES: DUF4352 domain-containing protein [unclassified Mammaliicoccus]